MWLMGAPALCCLQPPKNDAAIVGAVRLFSVLVAALTLDFAGRKSLLFVSGESLPPPPPPPPPPLDLALSAVEQLAQRMLGPWGHPLFTATIMFAANMTLGLYVHFNPRQLSPNSTVGLETESLGASSSALSLVPLLAAMFFIMGRCIARRGNGGHPGLRDKDCLGPRVQVGCLGAQPAPSSVQATPWAGGPSPGSSCRRSYPCGLVARHQDYVYWSAGSRPLHSPWPSSG